MEKLHARNESARGARPQDGTDQRKSRSLPPPWRPPRRANGSRKSSAKYGTLEDALNVTLQRFTEAHPDVQNLRSRLEVAKNRKQTDPEGRSRGQEDRCSRAPRRWRTASCKWKCWTWTETSSVWNPPSRSKDLEIADLESQIKQVQGSDQQAGGADQLGALWESNNTATCCASVTWPRTKYVDLERASEQGADLSGPGKPRAG